MKTIRRILAFVCFALAAAVLLPAAAGFVHLGLLYGVCLAAAGVVLYRPAWYARLLKNCRWGDRLLTVLCAFGLILTALVSALMLRAAALPVQDAGTLIVLGCRVDENGPSLMLRRRMDAALGYLAQNPDCAVIATGAQGRGENRTEASAIAEYLIENGADPARVYLEERAHNTDENMKYSAALIDRESLDGSVIIVTDGFHQYRASLLAKKYGLASSPLACATPAGVAVNYWFREILGVFRFYTLGY